MDWERSTPRCGRRCHQVCPYVAGNHHVPTQGRCHESGWRYISVVGSSGGLGRQHPGCHPFVNTGRSPTPEWQARPLTQWPPTERCVAMGVGGPLHPLGWAVAPPALRYDVGVAVCLPVDVTQRQRRCGSGRSARSRWWKAQITRAWVISRVRIRSGMAARGRVTTSMSSVCSSRGVATRRASRAM